TYSAPCDDIATRPMDLAGEASLRLNFDRMGKLDSALRAADHEFLPMGGVVRDDGRLRPVEGPAVLDSNHRIGAGNHAVESEAAVEVALVSSEQVVVGYGVFGDQ